MFSKAVYVSSLTWKDNSLEIPSLLSNGETHRATGKDYRPLLQSEQSCQKQKLGGQSSAASSGKSDQEIALAHTVKQPCKISVTKQGDREVPGKKEKYRT